MNLRIAVTIFLATLTSFGVRAGEENDKINIIFIGNSITEATYLSKENKPPSIAVSLLQDAGFNIQFANCGISGSTTVDFLPTSNRHYPKVIEAANSLNEAGAQLVFSIMLGTNDSAIRGTSGAPVSSNQYKQNLQCIADSLRARFPNCKIILNRPPWYSPNTHNSAEYLQEGLDRLQTYFPQIKALCKENSFIYEGDTKAFKFFKKNYLKFHRAQDGNSGTFYLHPNQDGAKKLGILWAKSLKKNLKKWGYKPNKTS